MLRGVAERVTDHVADDLVKRQSETERDIWRQAGLGAERVDTIDKAADFGGSLRSVSFRRRDMGA